MGTGPVQEIGDMADFAFNNRDVHTIHVKSPIFMSLPQRLQGEGWTGGEGGGGKEQGG